MPKLCGTDTCTGCSSCAQSCSNGALSMMLNDEGYYQPIVDSGKCIGCQLCEKNCPVLHPETPHKDSPKAYASWVKDDSIRSQSSSGGVFSAIAFHILQDHGVVWGVGYNDELHPVYKYVEHVQDLGKLRGSKYVQAEIGNAYQLIRSQLKNGRKVLFCGTPCHVAGLYSYLKGAPIENLLTVDFICHGVPSSRLFRNYIGWLEEKYQDKAVDFNFREGRFGINYNVGTSITFRTKGKRYLCLSNNSYTLGFCRDQTIHRTCGKCKFDGTQRVSDFTIGDYHGAKGEFQSKDQFKGISCVMVNSYKAKSVIKDLNLQLKEVPLEKIISTNPSYTSHQPSSQTLKLEEILCIPYQEVQKKYFSPTLRDKVKTSVMVLLGGRFSYCLKNKF